MTYASARPREDKPSLKASPAADGGHGDETQDNAPDSSRSPDTRGGVVRFARSSTIRRPASPRVSQSARRSMALAPGLRFSVHRFLFLSEFKPGDHRRTNVFLMLSFRMVERCQLRWKDRRDERQATSRTRPQHKSRVPLQAPEARTRLRSVRSGKAHSSPVYR